jgi:hypothetical protein
MVLEFVRVYKGTDCTLGVVLLDSVPVGVSLELPWRMNCTDVSCVPEGVYGCHVSKSPNLGYDTPLLERVHGRGSIRVHVGNYTSDIQGCILVGSYFGKRGEEKMVCESKKMFDFIKEETSGFAALECVKIREV